MMAALTAVALAETKVAEKVYKWAVEMVKKMGNERG